MSVVPSVSNSITVRLESFESGHVVACRFVDQLQLAGVAADGSIEG